MRKKALAAALAAVSAAPAAFAQTSVTLYGMLDAGVSYVSNQGGHSVVKFDDGIAVPSLFGFRGAEDLGGGLKAIFDLQSQFTLSNGSMIPGSGMLFGRNAWIGLQSDQWGTMTMGNQFDFINDSLTMSHNVAAVFVGGLYNYAAGPFQGLMLPGAASPNGSAGWDRTAQVVLPNSVKYVTPVFGGFKAGAIYAFGGKPGDFHTGSAVSVGVNYDQSNYGIGAAYTSVAYGASSMADGTPTPPATIRNWGVGAHYEFGALTAVVDFTGVHNVGNGATVYQGTVGGLYTFTPATSLGFSYMYAKGNNVVDNNHANQFGAVMNYVLSKRTVVYLSGFYQFANEGANAMLNGIYAPSAAVDQSSTNKQAIVRIGMRTFF